jgi:hypothetical protein
MGEEEGKAPSKNELKKLAKKAEKAAKKQGGGGNNNQNADPVGGGDKPAVEASAPEPAVAAPLPPSTPPRVLLFQAAKDDPATLKAVWAALHYQVDVGVAKRKDLPPGLCVTENKPVLIYGTNYVLGGGGNAMCKAIALMGGEPFSYQADELCEMERTTLRVSDAKQLRLDALATALEHSYTGIHLVGDSDSMADICILVSLSKFASDHLDSWPPVVQKYYKCHVGALERARAAVAKFLPSPPIDMSDPSMLKLVTSIFANAFEEVAPDVEVPSSIVKKCDSPKHGDYQCSGAMPVFASLKKSGKPMPPGVQGPPQLAQAIIDHLGSNHPVVQDMRIQGPGFIMCKISPEYLQGQVQCIMDNGSLTKPNLEPSTCLVDFSSPNIASKCL